MCRDESILSTVPNAKAFTPYKIVECGDKGIGKKVCISGTASFDLYKEQETILVCIDKEAQCAATNPFSARDLMPKLSPLSR